MSKRMAILFVGLMTMAVIQASYASWPVGAEGLAIGKSSPAEILDRTYEYIQWYEENQIDVPEETYDFYFHLERLVHPEFYAARDEAGTLDQFDDACPGTVINGTDFGNMSVTSTGSTMTANNDCTYPQSRLGRDVMVNLNIFYPCLVTITTAGSAFDTYLSLFEDNCCDGDNDFLVDFNNNNPTLNGGQRLAAGLQLCLEPDDYYIVLDGASVAARGSYRLTITIEDECNEEIPSR